MPGVELSSGRTEELGPEQQTFVDGLMASRERGFFEGLREGVFRYLHRHLSADGRQQASSFRRFHEITSRPLLQEDTCTVTDLGSLPLAALEQYHAELEDIRESHRMTVDNRRRLD